MTNDSTTFIDEIEAAVNDLSTPGRLEQILDEFLPKVTIFLINIVFALLILFIGRKIIKFLLKWLNRSFEKTNMDISVCKFLDSLIKAIFYAILILILADIVGVPTTSFVAFVGSAGLALGLAWQGSLSNFAGGILILLLKPFKVGDYIIEDSQKNEGVVGTIDLFYTKLYTTDNKVIIIPNGSLANSSLTNVTAQNMRRIDFKVGISYQADIKKAKELLYHILNSRENIIKEKDIIVYVDELGESAVILGFRAWTGTENYWKERWSILEEVKEVFDANGVEIPYNQLDVHIQK
ncbi:MAG: mechanosensitive ion channel [Lachnospiraceae bacterium]|jgi:small conductance mechanosensitive channel|nr:mechanosensitive ion channel [Lachnospiraceae bacterium]